MINKKILVTGSTGFVGQRFFQIAHNLKNCDCSALLDRGRINTENDISKTTHEVVLSNFDDPEELTEIFSRFDIIVHLIGDFDASCSSAAKLKMNRVNSDLAYTFARLAKESGVKTFIYISSFAAYLCEDKKKNRLCDCYGESKLSGENGLKTLSDDLFSVLIVRPTALFGPNHTGSIHQLAKVIKFGKYIHFSPSNVSANFYFIDDFIYLLFNCIKKDLSQYSIINASYGLYPIQNFIEKIKESVKGRRYIYLHHYFMLPISIFFSMITYLFSKPMPFSYRKYKVMTSPVFLLKNLDYKEPYGMNEGIKLTIEFFKKNDML